MTIEEVIDYLNALLAIKGPNRKVFILPARHSIDSIRELKSYLMCKEKEGF